MPPSKYSYFVTYLDDSGSGHPKGWGEYFVFAAASFPIETIHDFQETWAAFLSQYLNIPMEQARVTELKASDLYKHYRTVLNSRPPRADDPFQHLDLKTTTQLIDAAWNVICTGRFRQRSFVLPRLVAVVTHKREAWSRYCYRDYNDWVNNLSENPKQLAKRLEERIVRPAFEWITQRIDYLMADALPDVMQQTVYIGDEQNAYYKMMYERQGDYVAGRGYFTQLRHIINNIAFASSRFNPGLQYADWVAYAVAGWAHGDRWLSPRFGQLLPLFRGFPENRIIGRGLVLIPDNYGWPALPAQGSHQAGNAVV